MLAAVGALGATEPRFGVSRGAGALAELPVGLAAAVSSTLGAEQGRFAPVRRDGVLVARGGGLETEFGSAGLVVRMHGGPLSLRLTGVGRHGRLAGVGEAVPVASGNRISYLRGALEEWYLNGPLGLEQGFTLTRRPSGGGRVTLALRVSGRLAPRRTGGQIVFVSAGRAVATYGGLSAFDAERRPLPARLALTGRTLLLEVDDAGARYPLTIDPFLQQGDKLTGGGENGAGLFGDSVALSADGNTALVGGPGDDTSKGAAWVFTRTGTAWNQQGSKLTGSGETGAGRLGNDVALSADGNTALIGGPNDNSGGGAAWVFTRTGTAWNQQGSKLTGSGETGDGQFGTSVALSTNGNTALIGGHFDDASKGAAWVFTRTGTAWSQQGGKLTGSGQTGAASFGYSVALSAEGNTALIGGYGDATNTGAAWVFTRSGTTWSQQGGKLTGSGETGAGQFGVSDALSADGNTALIGGSADDASKGAAWVFTRSGSTWSQQGGKLTGSGEIGAGRFGSGVTLSADGNTALIGGYVDDAGRGAAWVFTRSGSAWNQQGDKLTGRGATGAARFGLGVALSAEAKAALIGGYGDDANKGAAWVFSNAPPDVTGISPATGPAAGGTLVTISGTAFTAATGVKFGPLAATLFNVVSDSQISAVSPAGQAGTVDVTVIGPTGTSTANSNSRFTYTAPVTPPKPAANPIVARIVYATVLGRGKLRTLNVKIRVSIKARAKLRLLRKGVPKLQKAFPVKGGANSLKARLPATVKKGVHQLEITLTDAAGHRKVYRASVLVPG